MHSLPDKLMHLDLKSKNVLVELNQFNLIQTVKLCDLGVSEEISEDIFEFSDTLMGTTRWMAPELILLSKHSKGNNVDEKADIWSFGMILYELITLKIPYFEVDLLSVKEEIMKGKIPSFPNGLDPSLLNLFSEATKFDSTMRPSAKQLLEICHHLLSDKT